MRRRAFPVSAVLVAVVVLALGACTSGGDTTDGSTPQVTAALRGPGDGVAPSTASSVVPKVGDCWMQDDYVAAGAWDYWQGAGPVDCQGRHNSITLAVVDVPADQPWPADATTDDEAQSRALALEGLCYGPKQDVWSANRQARLTVPFYQPSPDQVAAGQRWVRCDIALRALGPESKHALDALPATVDELKSMISAHPVRYQWCVDLPTVSEAGPRDRIRDGSAVTVSCEGASQWEMGATWEADLDHAPSQDEGMAMAAPICGALSGHGPTPRTKWIVYYPLEAEWALGYHTMTCWLY